MMLARNILLEWASLPIGDAQSLAPPPVRIDRILFIDETRVVLFDILAENALPRIEDTSEIEAALNAGFVRIKPDDPSDQKIRPESEIKINHREKRDKLWKVIQLLVEDEDGLPNFDIFVEHTRGKLISAVLEITGGSKATIYRDLKRFWRGGQVKNALLPHWPKSGGKGKRKSAGSKKRGRPNTKQIVTGKRDGINVNDDIRDKILLGFNLFYEKPTKPTLMDAYHRTLQKLFFTEQVVENGKLKPILPPAGQLPTYEQCVYWYKQDQVLRRTLLKRHGERAYNLRFRAPLGNATDRALGPTSVFEADACYGPVPLVSEFDPTRIIGFPIIYLMIDVYSRLIVGLAVTLDKAPKWSGAMAALINAMEDKVPFCKKYGVLIESDVWDSHHAPITIHADRGEFEDYDADTLPNTLGIIVTNTTAYRPDFKPFVEQVIAEIKRRLRLLPGATEKYRGQYKVGELDPRLFAALTLPELVKILIHLILELNNSRRIDKYPLTEDMIRDGVEPYPLEMWNWGVANLIGQPRILRPEEIRRGLLPIREASVSRTGIHYEGLFYTCDLAEQESWFNKAHKKRWKIKISIVPDRVGSVYLHVDGRTDLEPCRLTAKFTAFADWSWEQYRDYLTNKKLQEREAETRRIQARANTDFEIDSIVEQANNRREDALKSDTKSKSARLREIPANRKEERLRSKNESQDDTVTETPVERAADSLPDNGVNYVPKPSNLDKFRPKNLSSKSDNDTHQGE